MAKKAYENGNYPVGAVVAAEEEIISQASNEIKSSGSIVSHAENIAITQKGRELLQASEANKEISLFSTLEPCLQCLGAATMNGVKKIYFIQKDPNGGACGIKYDNIGLYYKEFWPEIFHAPISDEPLKLMLRFFHEEIDQGNTKWPNRMLKLLEK